MKDNQKILFTNERPKPSMDFGLTIDEVNQRKTEGLSNGVPKKYSKSYLSIFVGNICTFFNLLGLIVAIALIIAKAPVSKFFFVIIYLANLFIGIFQEIRAKHCIDRLSLMSSKTTKVLREGQIQDVSCEEVVLDDIILLGIGAQIPTDCEILDGFVEVNESLLTGESVPVKKTKGDTLLSGSFIVSGTCTSIAKEVGKNNYVQKLSAKAKEYRKPHSELMISLRLIIKTIGLVIVPMGILFMVKTMLNGTDFQSAITSTSAVVIGMIPSGMFLLTSLALAVGIIKLAKHNTLVQDLYSLEMLARVDTVCFDKTGTITDGKMTVNDVVQIKKHKYSVDEIMSSMLGTLKDNNQTAIALFEKFGQSVNLDAETVLSFNSARKLSAVTFKNIGTYSFGAPEFILDKKEYEKVSNKIDEYAKEGLRVLILAHSSKKIIEDTPPKDFTPIAYLLLVDNVREDAIDTIAWFKENDVAIKVISGDNPITVSEVSKRVGIENADKYISLEGLSDEEVYNVANEYTVFGRVSPDQKAILIKAIKSAGHVTAMTGDGVNDILALKEADCAITVASGSEAARNVAHLVLMDNNFSSMPKVVHEGRRVINNVQSSASLFLMKTLFTMILSLVTLILPFYKKYPIELDQMIFLEFFIIGLASFFLSMQPNDNRVEGKFINYVFGKSVPSAILMLFSFAVIEIFRVCLNAFPFEVYSTMSIYAITFAGIISLYNICKPLNKYRGTLFFTILISMLGIAIYGVINGLDMLSLVKLSPLETYWHHILIVLSVLLIDCAILPIFNKLFKNIKLPNFISKRL